ncbi:MAG: hypothetical protein WA116_08335 [Anaerolineaceae bacterium]
MKTKFLAAILAMILSVFFFSTVFASTIGYTTTLPDSGSDFTHISWLPTSSTGRNGSHQYTLYYSGYTASAWGKWSCTGATTDSTWYKWYVWIPLNYEYTDAAVSYYVRNSEEEYTITVNQENYANAWVFLGWAYGTGYIPWAYTFMDNGCVNGWGCNQYYQVWWDDAKYYPCVNSAGSGDCQ